MPLKDHKAAAYHRTRYRRAKPDLDPKAEAARKADWYRRNASRERSKRRLRTRQEAFLKKDHEVVFLHANYREGYHIVPLRYGAMSADIAEQVFFLTDAGTLQPRTIAQQLEYLQTRKASVERQPVAYTIAGNKIWWRAGRCITVEHLRILADKLAPKK
jgi:hypothetical protein